MRRPVVPVYALFAVCLAVTVAAIAVPAVGVAVTDRPGALLAEPGNDTVSQLGLPSNGSGPIDRASVGGDLSSTLTVERERMESGVHAQRFERAFRAAPETQERLDVVEDEIDRLETHAKSLRTDRRDVIRSYDRGEISDTELFGELARIRGGTSDVRGHVENVETVVEEHPETSLSSDVAARLTNVESDLVSLDGPVSDRVVTAVRGSPSPISVTLDTSEDGVVLSRIDGGTFVREAAVWSATGDSGTDQFASGSVSSMTNAYQRAEELYPWASDNQVTNPVINGIGNSPVYVVGFNHRHGELTTYLDGRTTDVFYEVQRLQLSRLPTETVATNETASLSMTVEATFENGPMAVTVSDGDGDPIEATVSTGNVTLGSTNAEGQLWIVDTGEPETISARSADGDTVSVRTER